jgi:hypothetical protein
MAGNYPDVPAPRIPYDKDGSVGYVIYPSNAVIALTTTQLQRLNDESDDAYVSVHPAGTGTHYWGIMFPQQMDLAAYFLDVSGSWAGRWATVPADMATSPDTTNGLDGTWTTFVNPVAIAISPTDPTRPSYRTQINTSVVSNIKSVRFKFIPADYPDPAFLESLHLYGTPHTVSGDQLMAWHPTLNQPLGGADLDWGNVPRNSSADKTFRVKNVSATKTANSVVLTLDTLTDTSPSVLGQHTVSYNGGAFAGTATIGNLAPGAISQLCTVRRITPSNAVLSLWALRVNAIAASFT